MKYEKRVIKASFYAGLSDVIIGLIMCITGWHNWYYEHFHFFGVLGIGMLCYAFWHYFLYETRGDEN